VTAEELVLRAETAAANAYAPYSNYFVGAFVLAWAGAFAIYKVRRIDERWAALVDDVA